MNPIVKLMLVAGAAGAAAKVGSDQINKTAYMQQHPGYWYAPGVAAILLAVLLRKKSPAAAVGLVAGGAVLTLQGYDNNKTAPKAATPAGAPAGAAKAPAAPAGLPAPAKAGTPALNPADPGPDPAINAGAFTPADIAAIEAAQPGFFGGLDPMSAINQAFGAFGGSPDGGFVQRFGNLGRRGGRY